MSIGTGKCKRKSNDSWTMALALSIYYCYYQCYLFFLLRVQVDWKKMYVWHSWEKKEKISLDICIEFVTCSISIEEFHHHVVLAHAENIFVIFRYIWPPEFKSEWCKCVHVERFEIWVKNAVFGQKNMFLFIYLFTHLA